MYDNIYIYIKAIIYVVFKNTVSLHNYTQVSWCSTLANWPFLPFASESLTNSRMTGSSCVSLLLVRGVWRLRMHKMCVMSNDHDNVYILCTPHLICRHSVYQRFTTWFTYIRAISCLCGCFAAQFIVSRDSISCWPCDSWKFDRGGVPLPYCKHMFNGDMMYPQTFCELYTPQVFLMRKSFQKCVPVKTSFLSMR